jgi:hypothetical protein
MDNLANTELFRVEEEIEASLHNVSDEELLPVQIVER